MFLMFIVERNVFFVFVFMFITIHYLIVWHHLVFQERCEGVTYHELVTYMKRNKFITYLEYRVKTIIIPPIQTYNNENIFTNKKIMTTGIMKFL